MFLKIVFLYYFRLKYISQILQGVFLTYWHVYVSDYVNHISLFLRTQNSVSRKPRVPKAPKKSRCQVPDLYLFAMIIMNIIVPLIIMIILIIVILINLVNSSLPGGR